MEQYKTRLETFMRANTITPRRLAMAAGVSRQHLLRLRRGIAEPTREVMVRLALAASVMRSRRVFIVEMFELTENEELIQDMLISVRTIFTTQPTELALPPQDGR